MSEFLLANCSKTPYRNFSSLIVLQYTAMFLVLKDRRVALKSMSNYHLRAAILILNTPYNLEKSETMC